MESARGSPSEGKSGSPRTATKMHGLGLGHVIGQQLGEFMGHGKRPRVLAAI